MHTFAAILRTLVGVLSAFGLLCPVFLLLLSPLFFRPLLFAGILYFALAIFGLFALLPRWHCLLGAVVLHLSGAVLSWVFCPPSDRAVLFGSFTLYLLLWWLAVGVASFGERSPQA